MSAGRRRMRRWRLSGEGSGPAGLRPKSRNPANMNSCGERTLALSSVLAAATNFHGALFACEADVNRVHAHKHHAAPTSLAKSSGGALHCIHRAFVAKHRFKMVSAQDFDASERHGSDTVAQSLGGHYAPAATSNSGAA